MPNYRFIRGVPRKTFCLPNRDDAELADGWLGSGVLVVAEMILWSVEVGASAAVMRKEYVSLGGTTMNHFDEAKRSFWSGKLGRVA